MRLPGRLTGNDPLVRWLNGLRDFAASCRITSFQGGYMSQGANGTQLILKRGNAQRKKPETTP